jgi:hypothetical protein
VYDPRESPDRLAVTYAGTPPARAELYLSALRADDVSLSGDTFYTAECCRQVAIGVGAEAVSDYQILCRFVRLSPDEVSLQQRVAVYLTPQDARYFDAINAAVALYDYDLTLEREERGGEGEGGGPLVCVQTPKDVTQCR